MLGQRCNRFQQLSPSEYSLTSVSKLAVGSLSAGSSGNEDDIPPRSDCSLLQADSFSQASTNAVADNGLADAFAHRETEAAVRPTVRQDAHHQIRLCPTTALTTNLLKPAAVAQPVNTPHSEMP